MSKVKNGIILVELIIGLSLLLIVTATSIPLYGQLTKTMNQSSKEAVSSAVTMENIISELRESRAILYPRAKKGAKRGKSLIFLDKCNNLGLIFSDGAFLWLRRYLPATGIFSVSKLGPCSKIIFHDRGWTRRCLRIRTVLGNYPLATTIHLTNSPFVKLSQGDAERDKISDCS